VQAWEDEYIRRIRAAFDKFWFEATDDLNAYLEKIWLEFVRYEATILSMEMTRLAGRSDE
jgi:hypothetical protein